MNFLWERQELRGWLCRTLWPSMLFTSVHRLDSQTSISNEMMRAWSTPGRRTCLRKWSHNAIEERISPSIPSTAGAYGAGRHEHVIVWADRYSRPLLYLTWKFRGLMVTFSRIRVAVVSHSKMAVFPLCWS